MHPDTWQILLGIGGAIVLAGGVYKVVWPVCLFLYRLVRKADDTLDLVGGRTAQRDPVTGEELPEIPPLGVALALIRKKQDEQHTELNELAVTVSDLTSVVQTVADQSLVLGQIQAQIAELISSVTALTVTAAEHDAALAALYASGYYAGSEKMLEAEQIRRGGTVPGEEPKS